MSSAIGDLGENGDNVQYVGHTGHVLKVGALLMSCVRKRVV